MQTHRDQSSGNARRGLAIVYLVALFDIASGMAPASAALHTDPPTGMRQCFRKFSESSELKKSATVIPVIDRGITPYFGSE